MDSYTVLNKYPPWFQTLSAPLLITICYYLGAKFGLALSFKPDYIAPLWPPNAVLLCALLLSSPSRWSYFLLAVVPAELLADLPAGIPLMMSLGFVCSDWIEVIIAVILFRKLSSTPPTFNTLRQTCMFIVCCVIVAPFFAAFPGAVITGIDPNGPPYITRWFRWFIGDALTHLVLTPPLVLLFSSVRSKPLLQSLYRGWEFSLFVILLCIAGISILAGKVIDVKTFPALMYLHLPLLIWAAVRFTPRSVFFAAFVTTAIAIWVTSRGLGPFQLDSASLTVFNLQLFFILSLTPIFFLASLMVERKQTEAKLKASEGNYADLYDNAPDMYVSVDVETAKIVKCNQTIAKALGYTKEEILDRVILDLYAPESLQYAREHVLPKFLKTGSVKNEELQLQTKEGQRIDVSLNASAYRDESGKIRRSRSVWRDITEQKQAQKDLEKSEKRYHTLVDAMNEGLIELDRNWCLTYANKRFAEMLGYSQEQLLNRQVQDFISEEYKDFADELLKRRCNRKSLNRETTGAYELEFIRSDGDTIYAFCSPTAFFDSKGNYIGGVGVVADITERKQAEEILREKEYIIASASSAIATADLDEKMSYVNPTFLELWGYEDAQEVLGKAITEFWMVTDKYDEIMKALKTDGKYSSEMQAKRKDGTLFDVQASAAIVYNESRQPVGLMSSSIDITERKKVEREKQNVIEELQNAIAEIKTLRGILPICSSCKKIRDDKGYWNQIESYIHDHSDARFSHSICPECTKKLYGDEDWFKDIKLDDN